MRVTGQRPFFRRQIREKAEASDAVGTNSCVVNPRVAPDEIAQIVPVEFLAALEFVSSGAKD